MQSVCEIANFITCISRRVNRAPGNVQRDEWTHTHMRRKWTLDALFIIFSFSYFYEWKKERSLMWKKITTHDFFNTFSLFSVAFILGYTGEHRRNVVTLNSLHHSIMFSQWPPRPSVGGCLASDIALIHYKYMTACVDSSRKKNLMTTRLIE